MSDEKKESIEPVEAVFYGGPSVTVYYDVDRLVESGFIVHPTNCGPSEEGPCDDCEKAVNMIAKQFADNIDEEIIAERFTDQRP